ncbi:MAG: glutathione S-transferase [Hellea sp.]|nr:glutathione S-transferase [Hellea sp.]
MTDPIDLMGAPGSPYTRKMLALMRYRHIPYSVHWTSGSVPDGFPKPKVALLPTYFLTGRDGELEAVTDSTPLIRRFEKEYEGRSAIPSNPVLAFLNDLIEDYGDEWLTKAMFHFRWAFEADYKNAGPLLIYWGSSVIDDATAQGMSDYFTKRQIDRLYVVGSNDITAPIIEAAYGRFVEILDRLLAQKGYVLGGRPSSADFAILGQMTQLAIVEPTSAKITRDISARVRAWVDRMDDLSGLSPTVEDWTDAANIKDALGPLLTEIGRTYTPVMLANAKAVMDGDKTFETTVDGAKWTQPTFKYQAKTLGWIRDAYFNLKPKDQKQVDEILKGSGCEALLET